MGEPAHNRIGFKRVRTSPQVLCKSMNEIPAQPCSTTISPRSICCCRQREPTCTVRTHQHCLAMDNGCPGSQFTNKVILRYWTVHLATLNRLSLLESLKLNLKQGGKTTHVCFHKFPNTSQEPCSYTFTVASVNNVLHVALICFVNTNVIGI